jgi:flagellar motility protein MotE (MotC chaperone)
MAEADRERDEDLEEAPPRGAKGDRPAPERKRPERDKKKPEKKRGRGCALTVLALTALLGGMAGLQAVGSVDLRPLLYEVVPRLPYVGKDLSAALGVPKIYTLTPDQRRSLELQQRQDLLSEEARSLDRERRRMTALSADLAKREAENEKLRAELAKRLSEVRSDDSTGATEGANLERLLRTFDEMSPRNAAQILAKMNDDLAVSLLGRLPEDRTAQILARMEAGRAATLTERLSIMKPQR